MTDLDHQHRIVVGLFLLLGLVSPALAFAQSPQDQAWSVLQSGVTASNAETRAAAVRTLTVITGDPKAAMLAEQGLVDKDPAVRAAAAGALGTLHSRGSIPKLRAALKDKEGGVVMAAAKSLVLLGNNAGYEVYYVLITGQRKSGQGLIGGEEKELSDTLHHPEQLASQAFEQGIGYVPYAGIAYGAFQHFHESDEKEAMVRAAAVKMLAKDPDPRSGQALIGVTTDKSWVVRAAAFDALARRGDRALLASAANGLNDSNETVKFMSAAAVAQLSSAKPAAAGN